MLQDRIAEGVDQRGTERPFLTVVMPLHEGSDWIAATLETLAREPAKGFEVIAIDSSPTTGTSGIAERFADRLPLHLLRRPDLGPWPTKTNLAVELARTDYVCMLHQDDLWMRGRMDSVRRWVERAPDAVLHLAPSIFVDRNGKQLGPWHCPLPAEEELDRDLLLERLLVQNFVSVPAPVIKRSAWLACGGMDDALWYTADWDIWLKLGRAGPVIYHDEFTTGFRLHGSSLTVTGSRTADDFRSQMEIVLDRHLGGISGMRTTSIGQAARASIAINVAIAAASVGSRAALLHALRTMISLGPAGMVRYLRDSRLLERVFSRLRAKFVGTF